MKMILSKIGVLIFLLLPSLGESQTVGRGVSTSIKSLKTRTIEDMTVILCTPSGIQLPKEFTSFVKTVTLTDCIKDYPENATPEEKASIDKKVCECVKKSPIPMLSLPQIKINGMINKKLEDYYQKEKETSFEIIKARTSTALDASILFENPKEIINDLLAPTKFLEKKMGRYLKESRKGALESGAGSKDLIKEVQNFFYSKENESDEGNVHNLKKFFSYGQLAPNQCITYREFHAFNQLPRDDLLMGEIVESNYKVDEWKYSELMKRYKEIAKLQPKDRKVSEFQMLKARIAFLDRNPMVRHLMDSDYTRKADIFKALQEFSRHKCEEGTVFTGSTDAHIEKYRTDLRDLLGNEEAQKILKNSISEEIERTLDKSENATSKNKKFESRGDLIVYLEELYQTSPESCRNSSSEGCISAFKHYCNEIDAISEIQPEHIADSLSSTLRGDFIPEMEKNANLKKMNSDFCDRVLTKTNDPNEKGYSFNQYRAKFCSNREMIECRTEFLKEYGGGFNNYEDTETIKLGNFLGTVAVTNIGNKEIEDISSGKTSTFADKKGFDWGSYRRDHGISGGSYAGLGGERGNPKAVSSGGTGGVLASAVMNNTEQPLSPGHYPVYTGPVEQRTNSRSDESENRKIEDLSPQEQYDLLNQWKRELASKNRDSGAHGQSSMSSADKNLQERIAALETLLLQQKTLSDRQYALLNDSLKTKEKELQERVADAQKATKNQEVPFDSYEARPPSINDSQTFNRAPASVRNTAGQHGGNTAGEAGRMNSVSGQAQALRDPASSEALMREEAKLVNLRQGANGAIVLEGTKSGLGANAIAVTISDEAYKQARSNLIGINLKQIEKNIPKDQIDILEKNGVITLILQNGQNPPLEVKVKRSNGALVQVENTEAIVRKFSLHTLQNTFKE